MTDQRWTLTLQDLDDPYRHSAHAVQRSSNRWECGVSPYYAWPAQASRP